MIPEKAYALAQSAGWVGIDLPAPSMFKWSEKRYEENYKRACDALTALDPTFFQALGRTLGWGEKLVSYAPVSMRGIWYINGDHAFGLQRKEQEWEFNAHRFYDLILTGQPTDKFWEELGLTKKEAGIE